MILGCGIDLCRIDRIERLLRKYPKFKEKILSQEEIDALDGLCEKKIPSHIAKRWAAKEALAKATGLGLSRIGLRSSKIIKKGERPFLEIEGFLKKRIEKIFDCKLKTHLSLSDDGEYAIACVILESE